MVGAMEVLVENLGQVDRAEYPAPGWYLDEDLGLWYQLYYDAWGQIHYRYRNIFTGLDFEPTAFHREYEYPATNIRSDAPIAVLEEDIIQVSFSFSYRGEAQNLVFRFGNCRSMGAGNYDEASTNTKSVQVSRSTSFVSYSSSGTFPFSWGGLIEAKHLFILPQGMEYDVVYLNAFKTITEAVIKDLLIESYVKA